MKWLFTFITVLICHLSHTCVVSGAFAMAADQPKDALATPSHGTINRPVERIVPVAIDINDRPRIEETKWPGSLAVIYPVLREPYNGLFESIIDGIRATSKLAVRAYPQTGADQKDLQRQLKTNDTKVAIVLGRGGFEKIPLVDKDLPILLSGVVSFVEDRRYSAISIAPDPSILLAGLKTLLPQVKKVHIVTNPIRNARILKEARDAAKTAGIELVEREANDLAASAKHYEAIFKGIEAHSEAVWLTQDTSVLSENLLPMILTESWNRHVAVISSTLDHVPRGVLFSAFPDSFRLGQSLAHSAASLALDKNKRLYGPLREVRTAVNVRTAGHLGIHMSPRLQSSFDYTFPEH